MANSVFSALFLIFGLISTSTAVAEPFPAVFQDRYNHLYWSKTLSGTYTNGCVDSLGKVDESKCTFATNPDGSWIIVDSHKLVVVSDSLAAQACERIGGRLPTDSEIVSLITNFDYEVNSSGPVLTYAGKVAMRAAFDNDDSIRFWSSSVYFFDAQEAFVFNNNWGQGILDVRFVEHPVRCVLESE